MNTSEVKSGDASRAENRRQIVTPQQIPGPSAVGRVQSVGTGRPPIQRKQHQKKIPVEMQNRIVKNDRVDPTKRDQHGKNNIAGKLSHMTITDPRVDGQNRQPNLNLKGRAPNAWGARNQLQQPHRGSHTNNTNSRYSPNFRSAAQFPRNQSSPPQVMHHNFHAPSSPGPVWSAMNHEFPTPTTFGAHDTFNQRAVVNPNGLNPVTAPPFEHYTGHPQYTVPYYSGANCFPQQQWAPTHQGNPNVPRASAEMTDPYMTVQRQSQQGVTRHSPPLKSQPVSDPQVTSTCPSPTDNPASNKTFIQHQLPPPAVVPANAQFSLSQLDKSWKGGPKQQKQDGDEPSQGSEQTTESQDSTENKPRVATGDVNSKIEAGSSKNEDRKSTTQSSRQKIFNLPKWTIERKTSEKMSSANGRRAPMNSRNRDSPNHTNPNPEVQEEVIKFICESWNKVYQEIQRGSPNVVYHTDSDTPVLPEDFVPFDLEGYWDRRLVNSIPQNAQTQNI